MDQCVADNHLPEFVSPNVLVRLTADHAMHGMLVNDIAGTVFPDSNNRSFKTGNRVSDLADACVNCCDFKGVATVAVSLTIQTDVVRAEGADARKVGCSLEEGVDYATKDAWLRFHSFSLSANLQVVL